MTAASAEGWRRLGLGDVHALVDLETTLAWGGLPAGNVVEVGEPLFPRLTEADLGA
jgi:methionyl-tRNA synthetase